MEVKKMIFGEEVPDKDDPKYKEKHENTVEAGKNFAKAVKLDKLALKVQRFASGHPKLFLTIIFAFVLFSIGLNLYRMSTAVSYKQHPSSAIERQEKVLRFNRHHVGDVRTKQKIKQEQSNDNPQMIEQYESYGQN